MLLRIKLKKCVCVCVCVLCWMYHILLKLQQAGYRINYKVLIQLFLCLTILVWDTFKWISDAVSLSIPSRLCWFMSFMFIEEILVLHNKNMLLIILFFFFFSLLEYILDCFERKYLNLILSNKYCKTYSCLYSVGLMLRFTFYSC